MAPRTSLRSLAAALVAAGAPALVAGQNTQSCADLVTALNACAAPATNSFADGVTAMNNCLCTAAISTSYQACLTDSQAANPTQTLTGVPIDGLNFGPQTALTSICTYFAEDVAAATGADVADSVAALEAFTTTSETHPQPPAGATVAAVGGGTGLANTDFLGAQVILAAQAVQGLGLTLQGILRFPAAVVVSTSTLLPTSTTSSDAAATSSPITTSPAAVTSSNTFVQATDATALPGQPAQSKSPNVFTGDAVRNGVSGVMLLAAVGAALVL